MVKPAAVPTLMALCIESLAVGTAPPRALMLVVRRLPEELVMALLQRMIKANTITDDRLAAFFTSARRVLHLQGCTSIRNSILRQIPVRCPQLRSLDLSNCAQVNNTVVRAVLQGCPSLQVLRLDGCRHITDAAFQPDYAPDFPLRGCATLQTISFARCSQLTSDLVLYLVLTCHNLTEINFSRCRRMPSDAIRQLLRSTTSLQRLTLSFTDITDDAFTAHDPASESGANNVWNALPRSLRAIDLTQSKVTDATLFAVASRCRYLEEARFSNCIAVTDVGIEALVTSCPFLRVLDMNNCGLLTDRGVSALGTHGRQLEMVNLSWCMNMTDKGIANLARGCERLQDLQLVWCTQLTDATLDAFIAIRSSMYGAERPTVTLHVSGCKRVTATKLDEARRGGLLIAGA
ncbi:hypothetical protein Poli38472_008908 [Pythium oligandrum]|uniref:F-box/LRR-repeat protein 15-like leucin rich repeat domain-containing protein n=1 Tax=Pythium oligandrum TaxID=41045 RepID=A0A8K1C4G3_PYTOL|nr:hypothetical protein Poli38472_008908 [Pythium oligandrum]|eukprot:TMW56260.1 hypothetical protein Poli38472_008908 [Pythium oligandrum]